MGMMMRMKVIMMMTLVTGNKVSRESLDIVLGALNSIDKIVILDKYKINEVIKEYCIDNNIEVIHYRIETIIYYRHSIIQLAKMIDTAVVFHTNNHLDAIWQMMCIDLANEGVNIFQA